MENTENLLLLDDSQCLETNPKVNSRSPSVCSVEKWPPFFVSRISRRDNLMKSRDPVIIERRNLVNISKLIVKELIDTSMKFGRMLDSDHMTLQHFFIVLEHVLRHGLRPKKGLLGPKKELWDILQTVEKLDPEAQDITSSIRDLPTVRTHMGRARAWLRVALMQKKLSDYMKVLIDNRDSVLAEYFEPDALMMSEEAIVIVGLLVGLNVIDCNLCIKEEDLDCEQGVIDFSLYLRSNHQTINSGESPDSEAEYDNMSTVLDQKNYIEELNRHLNATVANLQSQVESLTTTNALMKEDLEIAHANSMSLMQENSILKAQKNHKLSFRAKQQDNGLISEEKRKSDILEGMDVNDVEELRNRLINERKLRQEAEKELHVQSAVKNEMEVAMKLLEKDIHEKQDTIISLRKQLEDIKMINLEMYRKLQECEEELTQKAEVVSRLQAKTLQIGQMLSNLQKFNHLLNDDNLNRSPLNGGGSSAVRSNKPRKSECENSLKHKTELITKLEAKSSTMAEALKKMDEKNESLVRERATAVEALYKEKEQLKINAEMTGCLDGKLKMEKERKETLEKTLLEEREKFVNTKEENAQLKVIASKYVELQEENHKLAEQCKEQEKALEELGAQFGLSKLEMSDFKEEVSLKNNKSETQWVDDKEVTHCSSCSKEFSLTRRKHHCRNCGDIFCAACSDNTMALPSTTKPVRVCDICYHLLLEQYTVVVPN